MTRGHARRNVGIPFTVLVVGIVVTALVAFYLHETIRERLRVRFERSAAVVEQSLESHVNAYVALLNAARGILSGSEPLTRERFKRFAEVLDMEEQYPGIQGIGFSAVVRPDDRASLEAKMRAQGHEDFRISPEGQRSEYHSILFLEPEDRRNKVAIGYDMFSNEVRREAMIKARDSGVAAASGRVILVQEIDEKKLPGFLIYLPVYGGGITPDTLAERRSKLIGFVYSPFRAPDVLETVTNNRGFSEMAIRVFDGGQTTPDHLLYDSHPGLTITEPHFEFIDYPVVARRTWTMVAQSLPGLEAGQESAWVWLAMAGGGLVTVLLFALSWSQMRSRQSAEIYAAQLRDSQKKFAAETSEARRVRSEAENANRLKDQFLATVSHELRTPLNAIMGWTDLLISEAGENADLRYGLEVIRRNVKAQSQLVHDLLDISRITSGRLRLDIHPIDPREALEAAIESVRPLAEMRGIDLRENYCPEAPVITVDPARLQQIVWNLLSNAIKFSRKGGEVVLDLEMQGNKVLIRVTDHGEGIASEFLPHIFDAFRQADASFTRRHGGLGLGLAIVKHLVEMHGGKIEVKSEGRGKGAVFTVELPFSAARFAFTPEPRVETAQHSPKKDPGAELEGVRVLVVDDESDARELLRNVIVRYRGEALTASSAEEAVRLFASEKPQAIVSDIGMPTRNGYQLIREIRALEGDSSHTIAVALTAFASARDREAALSAGFDAHIPKPVRVPDLVETLVHLMRITSGSQTK